MALRTGTAGEALALARKAVEAEAGADSLAALARAQARLGDPAARETSEKATKAGTSSLVAHIARGDALLAARLGQDAEAAYRRAIEIDSRSAAAFSRPRVVSRRPGPGGARPREPRAKATQLDPRSGEAQAALGLAHLAQDPSDKASEAVAAVQQGVFLEPKNPLVRLTRGPRLREPRTARGGRGCLRGGRRSRPDLAHASGGRARPSPAPGRHRRGDGRARRALGGGQGFR